MEQFFHHALRINYDLCFGCTHCMSVCPTEAIRVKNGKAIIAGHRCIDCGMCFKSCPANAFYVEQDDFSTIFNYKHRVILYPSVLTGQLLNEYSAEQIIAALYKLGFTHVFEVEHGADFTAQEMQKYQEENEDVKPLMSSFCPAIVRLIQVRFPSLVGNLIRRKPPIDIASMYYRKKLEDQGIDSKDIGIFYITSCSAKIAAVKSPVGENSSSVDGIINMKEIYNRIQSTLRADKDIDTSMVEKPQFSSGNILWSLTNGEKNHLQGRCLAIDEVNNVIEFLEKLEMGDIDNIDFVELRACDESCAGGIFNVENRFLTVEQMRKRAQSQSDIEAKTPVKNPIYDYADYLSDKCVLEEIKPRSMVMDEDVGKAIAKLEKSRRMMCYLPGIDCGACGTPSCSALSKDIAQRKASLSDCVFIHTFMKNSGTLSHEKSLQIVEKTWGVGRIDKDCTKKGAKNENQNKK